ncbi:MAG: hypothetical protein Q8R48_02105 [Candidatus Omnitrophota bacterium]|nr:hypothetical protein [Candidatus Omnitrophota bacterium]
MAERSILWYIKQLKRRVFTTHELCALSGKSASSVTQALNFLEKNEVIFKIYRGIWAEAGDERLSPYIVIPFLLPRHRAYVSFVSALHLYGIIEQIPQIVDLATTAHTKTIRTKIGTYRFHQVSPAFFDGFGWYKGTGTFLIAEPEKALADSLYLSTRRKKQFAHFPELYFPKSFDFKKARKWIKNISEYKIRTSAEKKLERIEKEY